jgi:hypothetical protein
VTRRFVTVAIVVAAIACKSSSPQRDDAAVPHDAAPPDGPAWPELASYSRAEPVRVVALPSRPDVPRFDVGGPVVSGDMAIVSSSQFGFIGIDWRRGAIAWSKPAGLHVAPPLAHAGDIILIGDCLNAPDVRDRLLGCARVVTAAGADQAYVAIHGASVAAFADARGTQDVWPAGDHAVRWRRGDEAVTVDLLTGVATRASIEPPPLVVTYKTRRWEVSLGDGKLVAKGKQPWELDRTYTALLGAVYLPDEAPMLRLVRFGSFAGNPEMNLFDIDATGSKHGQVSFPIPGISLLGHATSSVGDVALAMRLDRSIRRDYIVGFAASSLLMWVYPLPVVDRADPVGVAIASEAVLVFHDGDTFTILPELSAPPTAPGAVRAPSENPTP